ncbi:MAG: hypothetical protein QOG62_508 [Thermoleophilaceae bacterium]|nr:hypothetical protein [Thermoleophilaceae bacterium]
MLLVAVSMPWYTAERGGAPVEHMTFSWDWVPALVILLLFNCLLALGIGFSFFGGPGYGRARPINLLALAIASAAFVWSGFRLGLPPSYSVGEATANVHASLGPWFATGASLAILRGQWLAAGLPAGRVEKTRLTQPG